MSMIGNYKDRAMYDSYALRVTSFSIVTNEDVIVESEIHIKDIAGDNGKRVDDLANELGYRIMMLQMLAASTKIQTQTIEKICRVFLDGLPDRPNFGSSKHGV